MDWSRPDLNGFRDKDSDSFGTEALSQQFLELLSGEILWSPDTVRGPSFSPLEELCGRALPTRTLGHKNLS